MLICVACGNAIFNPIIAYKKGVCFMINENIKTIRKSKGLSQEELATKLNVVRQTISKWEKGYSVPDAEMISKMSEVFEIPVSELLGQQIKVEDEHNMLAEQLAQISEQLAEKQIQRKKILKFLRSGILVFMALIVLVSIWNGWTSMWYQLGEHIYRWFH